MNRAIQDRHDLRGVTRTFFKEAERTGWKIKGAAFLEPYILNPVAILRAKGIELFNFDVSSLRLDKAVADDLAKQLEYEKGRYRSQAKAIRAAEHDIVLWHFVQRKRPQHVDSPLDVKYWLLTLDSRLVSFDLHKNRRKGVVAICVHPAVLLEMLQFWIPRTEDFDIALFRGLRFLLPQRVDAAAEQVTLNILGVLSRFEGAPDLDEQTIAAVLMNKALRARLKSELDDQVEVELVRDALIEEMENLQKRLREEVQDKDRLSAALDRKEVQVEELKKSLEFFKGQKELEIGALKEGLVREKSRGDLLEIRISKMEEATKRQLTWDVQRRRFLFVYTATTAGILGLVMVATMTIAGKLGLGGIRASLIGGLLALLVMTKIIEVRGRRKEAVRDWEPFKRFCGLRTRIFTILGSLLGSILSSYVYDIIKD